MGHSKLALELAVSLYACRRWAGNIAGTFVPTVVFAICLMLEGLRKLLGGFIIRFIGPCDLLNKALS